MVILHRNQKKTEEYQIMARKMKLTLEDYIRINKALAREEELVRNGGRWVAVDRPHRNKKKYCRKKSKIEMRNITGE